MRRLPAAAVWYALAVLVVVAGPAAVVLLLGTPELALPSEWADTRSRIADGTYPAGHVVDIVSGLGLLAWLAGLWLVVTGMRKRRRRRHRDSAEETDGSAAGLSRANGDNEADEPWYRQGAPIFDEPFTDEYPRVVVPPDETAPGDEPADSPWQPAPVAAGVDEPFGMPPPDPMAADMVADAEVIAGAGLASDAHITGDADTMRDADAPDPDDPPMIVPVRAYYFTRAGDTLRSISAQFLNTPMRWEELRSLNAASPGVSVLSADSLLPVGTALALPGDPLPWGRPDPVYLWTLAEKFLFTAWGREPTPEEVVPFWRGLTGGAQLEAGAPPIQPEHLTAPASAEPPPPEAAPAPEPPDEPAAESAPPEVAHEPEPAPVEPPPAEVPTEPAPEAAVEETVAESPAIEVPAEPAAAEPPPPEVAYEPEPAPAEPPPPDGFVPAPPPATPPTDFQPPPPITAPPFDSPVPPTHEPAYEPAAYQPPPAYEPPVFPTHEPAPPAYEHPVAPAHEPAAYQPVPGYDSPVPPTHEPAYEPAAYQPPPAYESPVPPTHEPAPPAYEPPGFPTHEPAAYQPVPGYDSPVPPTHEPAPPAYDSPVPPAHAPAAYQPPPAYDSPVPPSHEPAPPMAPEPALPDLGPLEPEVPYVEAEAPRMPSFMPSLTGAETAVPAPEADMVASSNRGLAGTALGDAMMLWQLSRIRRRRGARPDALDPMEESLRQSARTDTLNLIEAAMRHLRAVTVGQLREKPTVLAVRVGTYGFEVLLNRPTQAPDGWQAASGGYVLELPQGVTAEDLEATAQGPTLCPALVPVGDTLEGPLLLNIEEIGCLIVSGPGGPSVNLLNAVVGTLGSSPLAGDIRIITVGLDTPAGLPGWERVHTTSFDSPQLEELLSAADTGSGTFLDVLVVGPGNDILIQRAGQVATTPGSRLALVGATSSVAARWPWRIHVDETTTAVVHPIACTMAAAQAMAPAMSQLLSEATDPSLLAPPRY
ncbi:MAG: hypothetical protein OXG66_02605 [Acidimicrobiaceae bacterium]|nr:hypothetical protein [Acidimicrobiaceae bacterium]